MKMLIKILPFFIVAFFVLNVFSLSGFFDGKNISINGTAVEQFFATAGQPIDILAKMMSQKTQNKTQSNTAKEQASKDLFKIAGNAGSSTMVLFIMLTGFVLCKSESVKEQISTMTRYPLKIPWRTSIFLLLLVKILFNVRPRAGDIYVYNYAVPKVCVA